MVVFLEIMASCCFFSNETERKSFFYPFWIYLNAPLYIVKSNKDNLEIIRIRHVHCHFVNRFFFVFREKFIYPKLYSVFQFAHIEYSEISFQIELNDFEEKKWLGQTVSVSETNATGNGLKTIQQLQTFSNAWPLI